MGTDRQMNYPEWVCSECGNRLGRRVPDCASWHHGVCGVCGEDAYVTEPRDFGHLAVPSGLGPHIRELRERQRMTQGDLAKLSGMTKSQVSLCETGRRIPTLANLYRIREALDCTWNELL